MSDTTLIQRLREWCNTVRRKPCPIADAIPMVQEAADALEQQAAQIEALRADAEQLRVGHERYETVRLLSVPQFQDAYVLNRRTGKPFDEIIDDLRPFMRPHDAALRQEQPT